jgi:phosphatidylethanolamine/phosphatidyl-N-methylethanolamine N-methyltransferase
MADSLRFFLRFLHSPRAVGALFPSSAALARRMVEDVVFAPGRVLVEFGPGTGAFTAEIAARLVPGMHYLGIERDPEFTRLLRQRYPQLKFHCGSVEDLPSVLAEHGLPRPDHIISGIPFASIPTAVGRKILESTRATLRPGGTFATFQYVHAYVFPNARALRLRMAELFGTRMQRSPCWRNIPPTYILRWKAP